MGDALPFWTAYVGCGLLCVLLAYLGGRRRKLRPVDLRQDAAAVECARCGYDVRGLPGHVCPECGSDLDVVGRMTPRFRKWQKVPPVLRAGVWTLGVAAAAAICLVFAVGGYLPMQVVRRSVQRFAGASGYYEVEEQHAATLTLGFGNAIPADAGGVSPQEAASATAHVLRLTGHPGGATATPEVGALRWDLRADRWDVRIGGIITSRGEGTPTPEALLELTRAVDAAPASPTTRPGQGPPPTRTPRTPEAEAALLARALLWPREFVVGRGDYEAAVGAFRLYEQRMNERWDNRLPAGVFEMASSLQARSFAYGQPAVLTSPVRGAGGGERVRPSWPWLGLAAGFWLLVWLAGLPFVLRRRAVRAATTAPSD